jgi:hypothetical protein
MVLLVTITILLPILGEIEIGICNDQNEHKQASFEAIHLNFYQ